MTLADGRVLSYGEYGDPAGKPVIYAHGWPSAQVDWALFDLDHTRAARLGLRILAPDRPGYGTSTPKPRRTLLDWSDDVRELADALNLDKFGLLGYSAGGPFMLATAYRLPERVSAAVLVDALAPLTVPGATTDMHRMVRLQYTLAHRLPSLFRFFMGQSARRSDAQLMAGFSRLMPISDRAVMDRPDVQRIFLMMVREAGKQGWDAAALEGRLLDRPWGFEPKSARVPVQLWQGAVDTNVPPAMARSLASALPKCEVHFLPGEGHMSMPVNHAEEMLAAFV
jgi:pimeloyl-ACP methyl ester carboxylesterase